MILEAALVLMLGGGPKPAPCSEIRWSRGVEQRVELLRCLSRVFPRVSFSTAYQVAQCESGPNLDPRTEYYGSVGLFQHQRRYWRARAIKYLTPRWGLDPETVPATNAYANAIVTYSMVADRHIGWGPWSCYR